MLKSDWFASVIQVKPDDDFNILRLTPFLVAFAPFAKVFFDVGDDGFLFFPAG